MAKQEKKVDSKYSVKRCARFAMGGRSFRSLGEGDHAAEVNPSPMPLAMDYTPMRPARMPQGFGEFIPGKHEDAKMVSRFRNKDFVYPKPKFKKLDIMVKYDHFAMNYTGWNS